MSSAFEASCNEIIGKAPKPELKKLTSLEHQGNVLSFNISFPLNDNKKRIQPLGLSDDSRDINTVTQRSTSSNRNKNIRISNKPKSLKKKSFSKDQCIGSN